MIYEILVVMFASFLPVAELRGGIPLGLFLGLDPVFVIPISLIVNALVFFPVYFVLEFLYDRKLYKYRTVNKYLEKIRLKGKKYIDRYGIIGLIVFIGIPLPSTGVWTASAISWVLRLGWKKSFIAVVFGVLISGTIVSLISLGVLSFF